MKRNKREKLIKVFEMLLITSGAAIMVSYVASNGPNEETIKMKFICELCLDELRRDKPSEKRIMYYMDKLAKI